MNKSELQNSIQQYNNQLTQVDRALHSTTDASERESLLALQSDLRQLLELTSESLAVVTLPSDTEPPPAQQTESMKSDSTIDDEYALFMMEMAESGAYNDVSRSKNDVNTKQESDDGSDLEDELQSLPGTKCGVYHTHAWGGQPTLHNAMVASIQRGTDQLHDLEVRVLFTHPTHAEMLPCPFYLDGDCKFSDQQCRYSHGEVFPFSNLQEAIEPDFESLRLGSRVLVKLKPPDGEDITLTKKSSEKYHLWHRAVVKSINVENKTCHVKLEQGGKAGEKRKATDEFQVAFEELFPLNDMNPSSSDSEESLSDMEYPEARERTADPLNKDLLLEQTLHHNGPVIGEWERHTRGMGSKLMLAMGYVAGTGLGAAADGRLEPVPARVLPAGKSLDHCMQSDAAGRDPLQVDKKLKRLQKKEEERNKRLQEREEERERRNVFNFLNRTLGDQPPAPSTAESRSSIRQSSSKTLNVERFKVTEDVKRVERDVLKLKNTLYRHAQGSNIHKNLSAQISEKNRELESLHNREREISREQSDRNDKRKLTLF